MHREFGEVSGREGRKAVSSRLSRNHHVSNVEGVNNIGITTCTCVLSGDSLGIRQKLWIHKAMFTQGSFVTVQTTFLAHSFTPSHAHVCIVERASGASHVPQIGGHNFSRHEIRLQWREFQ